MGTVAADRRVSGYRHDLLAQVQTNALSVADLIAAIMPHWRERKFGFLVANSSIMAWWDIVPGGVAYAASKAAMDRKPCRPGLLPRPSQPLARSGSLEGRRLADK